MIHSAKQIKLQTRYDHVQMKQSRMQDQDIHVVVFGLISRYNFQNVLFQLHSIFGTANVSTSIASMYAGTFTTFYNHTL